MEIQIQEMFTIKHCYTHFGICETTREHFKEIFNEKERIVNLDSVDTAWQTSTSSKVTRMALNLWNSSIMYDSEEDLENERISKRYAPSDIFCCSYAPFFWEAIRIRYPEYTRYNSESKYNNLKNIVAYIRTAGENLIYNQKVMIENYCRKNNITIQKAYIDEGFSGRNMDRPEIQRLINDIKDDKINKVIFSSADRVSRNMSDWLNFEKLCDKKSVELISTDGTLESREKYIKSVKDTIMIDLLEEKRIETKEEENIPEYEEEV